MEITGSIEPISLKSKTLRLAGVLTLALSLAGCASAADLASDALTWIPVSAPPGLSPDDQCYGYFVSQGLGEDGRSFSSVECAPGEDVPDADERQLVWREIDPPPNQEGPCYGVFERQAMGDLLRWYSASWCADADAGTE